jgi:lysozyme family protein
MADFNTAFAALVGNEGGYVNNPADPGGATRWGITQRVARAAGYLGDMRDFPLEQARVIAKHLYWDPLYLDEFDDRMAFAMLDANYNGGHVVLWAQQAVGVKADGKLGPTTISALRAADPMRFVMAFTAYRLLYLTSCHPWPTFSRGWSRRIANNLLKAVK